MLSNRYAHCEDAEGTWSVIDAEVDSPAVVQNRMLVGLDGSEAKNAADLLNMIEGMRSPQPSRPIPADRKLNPLLVPIR